MCRVLPHTGHVTCFTLRHITLGHFLTVAHAKLLTIYLSPEACNISQHKPTGHTIWSLRTHVIFTHRVSSEIDIIPP
jgi:hypothetical protein